MLCIFYHSVDQTKDMNLHVEIRSILFILRFWNFIGNKSNKNLWKIIWNEIKNQNYRKLDITIANKVGRNNINC